MSTHKCDKEREIDLIHSCLVEIKEEQKRTSDKIEELNSWKFKLIGGGAIIGFLAGWIKDFLK